MATTITLEEGKHYSVRICPISGCDWVLAFPNEMVDWLHENIEPDTLHTSELDFRDCRTKEATLTFDIDEDAMAFKLAWL